MKKRIFSFLTALCLCLTLLPTAARAENNWESWTIFDGTNLNLSDGSYYLGGNVTISGEITISGAVTFDLNGYTLTCNATDEDMFCVYDGKTLTIKDSGTDGTIDGQNKNCGFSVSGGTLILESSIIANCRDDDGDGGAVDIGKDCVFTMRGGTISNCNAQHEGGAIVVKGDGSFTMSGNAAIADCTATSDGGGVYVKGGSMTMSDNARISGCTAASSESAGIYLAETLTPNGGTVENTVTVAPSGKIESGTETKFMAKVSNYGTISGGTFNGSVVREVSNDADFLAALADSNVTTIKLMGEITVNATENVKELTIDRAITLVNSSRAPLHLNLLLAIAKDGALTLEGVEGSVYLYPYNSVEVNGRLTVGVGCGVIFEAQKSSLVINEGGTVTTVRTTNAEAAESGLLSLEKNVALTVDGTLVNNGRLSVSDMENLKKAASIGGDLILNGVTVDKDYTLDMQGNLLTICDSRDFSKNANLTVKNASRVDATGVTISGGSYYCPVPVGGQPAGEYVITSGSFYGPVTVKDEGGGGTPNKVSGGIFYGGISGMHMISGGTFYNGSFQEGFSLPEAEGIESGCKVVTYKNGEDVYAVQVVNGKASAPDTPVKSGCRFVGWYNGNAKWDFDTSVTENLTLTAKWEKIHTYCPIRAAL